MSLDEQLPPAPPRPEWQVALEAARSVLQRRAICKALGVTPKSLHDWEAGARRPSHAHQCAIIKLAARTVAGLAGELKRGRTCTG